MEARARNLESELKVVNDLLSKEDGEAEGEVADGEKPAGDGEGTDTNTNTEIDTDETNDDKTGDDDGQEDLAGKVKELEAQIEAKDEKLSVLQADNDKLKLVVESTYTAAGLGDEGDAE